MDENIFELAAIASAAVSSMNIIGVSGLDDGQENSALVVDDQGKKWCVRSALTAEHSEQLDHELQNIKIFTPAIRASLPFSVAHIIGRFRQDGIKTYVYSYLNGAPFDTSLLGRQSQVERNARYAESVGRCLAALHSIPVESLEANSLPCYRAAEFRSRKLKELDQAAATGKIPARLLSRWEETLENVSLWHFAPTVVHGDLNEDNILTDDTGITAITAWSNLHGGDPAEDFMWIATLDDDEFKMAVLRSYETYMERAHNSSCLLERADFHAEFALAQWLIEGLVTADAEKVSDAEKMLETLDNRLRFSENSDSADVWKEEHPGLKPTARETTLSKV